MFVLKLFEIFFGLVAAVLVLFMLAVIFILIGCFCAFTWYLYLAIIDDENNTRTKAFKEKLNTILDRIGFK